MNLQELKKKTPSELIIQAEKLEIENPSTLRKQEILFAILKKLAEKNEQITGGGVLEVLQDGFGFLRAIESNYLPGPDDIYVSPSQIRKFGLRTGYCVEGEIRAPKDSERYFALLKVDKINFDDPEKARNKIAFDNLSFFWLQLKLVFVIILTIYHFFLFQCLRKFAENNNTYSSKFYRIINEIPTLLLIGIVLVVVFKPL